MLVCIELLSGFRSLRQEKGGWWKVDVVRTGLVNRRKKKKKSATCSVFPPAAWGLVTSLLGRLCTSHPPFLLGRIMLPRKRERIIIP